METKKLKGRILYAEDEPLIRKCVSQFLSKLGYEVIQAENGREAYDKFEEEQQKESGLVLIITDLQMPEWDGITFTKEVRKYFSKQIPILGITGWANSEIRQQCEKAGFNKLLFKPITINNLKSTIDSMINRNGNRNYF